MPEEARKIALNVNQIDFTAEERRVPEGRCEASGYGILGFGPGCYGGNGHESRHEDAGSRVDLRDPPGVGLFTTGGAAWQDAKYASDIVR